MPGMLAFMRAIRGSDLPPTDRHILMTLASLADPDTGIIPDRFTPSFTDLSRFTGLGRSTVGRRLPFIEEAGWIKRTAPSLAAAWKDKEKNSYALLIPVQYGSGDGAVDGEPTSPRTGLVPEGDQSDDQSQSGTSPTAGPVLVPERDRTSPTAGLEVPDLRTKRSNTAPTERRTRTTMTLFGEETPPAPPVTAQTILGNFIDYCTEKGVQVPKRLKGQYAKGIKDALEEEFSDKTIRNALASMVADNIVDKPALLTNRLVAVQTGPEKRNRQNSQDRRSGDLGSTRHRVQDSHANIDRFKENI